MGGSGCRASAGWSSASRWRGAVGRRLFVAPEGTDPEAGPDDLPLRLDPGMAFGTGEHGTTRGTLRLMERAVSRGDRVLDVGTGSGILALAAVRLGAERVLALDVDAGASTSPWPASSHRCSAPCSSRTGG